MANRDLLTDAIADAKAVKETAIANAKLALEEAFTPFLKDQLSAKLAEMDKDDKKEKEVKEEEEKVEEMDAVSWNEKNNPTRSSSVGERDPKKVGQATPKYAINVNEEEIDEEINLDELLAELDEIDEAKKHDSKKGNKEEQKRMEGAIRDDRDHIKDLEKDIKDNEKKLAKLKADEPKDVNESEETLDEVEVKEEKEKEDDSKKKMEESEISEDARTDAEEEGYLDGEKDEKEDMEDKMDDEEIDLEDMSEDDLKGFIEDVIKDMVSAGEIEPGDEFVEDEVEVEDVEDVEVEDDVDIDVEIDEAKKKEGEEVKEAEENLDEMSKKEKEEGDMRKPFKDRSKAQKMTLDMSRDGESDSEMKEELEAAIAQVNELKAELNEVNLLNAKLLYTNKIFKAKNLNEGKKIKVLKAFDKAKDVAQAKTIYETLNEGLIDKSVVNESRIKGSASKATGLEPKSSKQPIIESNDVYDRMRKLAGLL